MITLYGFSPNFGLSDPSPFVLKVEAYLKMAGLPYQKKYGLHYLKNSPKGKLPFIVDEQTTVADSQFIIEYLEQKNGQVLDGHLSAEEKALSYLIKKSLDLLKFIKDFLHFLKFKYFILFLNFHSNLNF